jgi:hypothetical protein
MLVRLGYLKTQLEVCVKWALHIFDEAQFTMIHIFLYEIPTQSNKNLDFQM